MISVLYLLPISNRTQYNALYVEKIYIYNGTALYVVVHVICGWKFSYMAQLRKPMPTLLTC